MKKVSPQFSKKPFVLEIYHILREKKLGRRIRGAGFKLGDRHWPKAFRVISLCKAGEAEIVLVLARAVISTFCGGSGTVFFYTLFSFSVLPFVVIYYYLLLYRYTFCSELQFLGWSARKKISFRDSQHWTSVYCLPM